MINLIKIDGDGRWLGSAQSPNEEVSALYAADGFIPGDPPASYSMRYINGAWVLPVDVAKDVARGRINAARNAAERAGFTAYGKPFDADDKAIQRVSVAAQAAQMAIFANQPFSIDWTCADNTTITLTAEQLVELPVIMAQAANGLHVHGRSLKAQIDAATTIEEIEAITW